MAENTVVLEFGGQIFQVKADPLHPNLAVEVRFPESRQVEYHWVDLEEKEPVQSSGYQDWWTGLHAVRGRKLLLNHFEDPSLPVHKGVEIREMPGFRLLYEHSEAVVLAESETGLLLGLDQGKGIMIVDGAVENPITDGPEENLIVDGPEESHSDEYAKVKILKASELETQMHAPEYAAYQSQLFAAVRAPDFAWPDALAQSAPVRQYPPFRPGASVLRWDDHLVAAWHSPNQQGGYQLLLTFMYKEVTQWTQVLHPSLDKLNPEPFFMVGNYVIWIAESNQLCWQQL